MSNHYGDACDMFLLFYPQYKKGVIHYKYYYMFTSLFDLKWKLKVK